MTDQPSDRAKRIAKMLCDDYLTNVLEQMPYDEVADDISTSGLAELEATEQDMRDTCKVQIDSIGRLEARLAAAERITCPNCDHTFNAVTMAEARDAEFEGMVSERDEARAEIRRLRTTWSPPTDDDPDRLATDTEGGKDG